MDPKMLRMMFGFCAATDGGDGKGAGGEDKPAEKVVDKPAEKVVDKPKAADPMAAISALTERFDSFGDQITQLVGGLVQKATAAETAAADAAKKSRSDKVRAELVGAGIDDVGQGYAVQDLGDLDLEKEADRVKLTNWVKAKAKYFADPSKADPADPKPKGDDDGKKRPFLWGPWGRRKKE